MAAYKLSSKFKELRILLCQTSKSSDGVRQFIHEHYVSLKKANPKLPILIRECSKIEPKVYVRAEFGKETCIPVSNMSSSEVAQKIKDITAS